VAANAKRRRSSSRASNGTDATPTQQSERAQAKRFSERLRRELAEMTEKLVAAEAHWLRRCESIGYSDPPARLAAFRRRVADLEGMLKALSARFPRI
jgi:RNA polymerase-binding transcription factor DksA